MSWMNIMDSVSKTAKPTNSFMDGLSSFGGKVGGYLDDGMSWANKNKDALGTIGGLAQGYMQYDMGQKQYDMQKKAFDYNKALSARSKRREEDQEDSYALGFQNSELSKAY